MMKMTDSLQFISFDSVVGNALFILYQHNIKEVTFEKLVQYAKKIAQKLEKHNDIRYGLLFSRKYQLAFLQNNADFFKCEFSNDGNSKFSLSETVKDKEIKIIENRFRWTMAVPFLEAFYDENCIQALLA